MDTIRSGCGFEHCGAEGSAGFQCDIGQRQLYDERMRSRAVRMGLCWRRAKRMAQDGRRKGDVGEKPVFIMARKASAHPDSS